MALATKSGCNRATSSLAMVALSIALTSVCSGFVPDAWAQNNASVKISVPLRGGPGGAGGNDDVHSTSSSTSTSADDLDARIKAEARAAEARQNEALEHYDASHVYLSGGNTELAELELQAAIMDDPNVKAYHRDYCVLSILRGHPLRAVVEAMMVVGLGDPIPLSDKQEQKLKDQGCKLHYRRGIALEKKADWKNAITEFQWALEYRPNNGTVMRSMAFANASAGNIELAEKQYGSSFASDPADAYGHADLAFLLAQSGKSSEALKQLQEAVKLQPKVAALHIDLGWMAESKGDLNEAEGEFAEAVKLSPKHASLWTHLGKLLAKQGKADQAAQAYKTALGLDPQAVDAQTGLESLKQAPPKEPAAGAKTGTTGVTGDNNGGGENKLPKLIKAVG